MLVGGLNDILRGAIDTEIMQDIWDFNETVRNMCFSSSENYWSSFAAATLPFPPRLTVLLKDSRKNIKNRRKTLVNLNSSNPEMNRDKHHPALPTQLALCFHTWGILTRKGKKLVRPWYLLESWLTQRLSEWRKHKHKEYAPPRRQSKSQNG